MELPNSKPIDFSTHPNPNFRRKFKNANSNPQPNKEFRCDNSTW